jgi:hypothetical protein
MWRGTPVAVKTLKQIRQMSQKDQLSFIREAIVLRKHPHPNILMVMGMCLKVRCLRSEIAQLC